ncbi:helix-turn-helix domain-containing protein [Actinoplanes sp. NPDC026619]|uniref:TetR/AcrR family transcriptional regulator n=1 Tax=Actinoplanes sp. NPDC026619 TaxID=3155798 RepID=UPI00340E313E
MTAKETGHRPLRADASRNRERIVEVATRIFAEEGLAVPIHEIARRAGVGVGTVGRHFPTKEALFEAVVLDRARLIAASAENLSAAADPATAFFRYFAGMVAEGAINRGLAQAFGGIGFDMGAASKRNGYDILGTLERLLEAAQAAGAVRADVDLADVKAFMIGCLSRESRGADPAARDRMIAVICDGMRVRP